MGGYIGSRQTTVKVSLPAFPRRPAQLGQGGGGAVGGKPHQAATAESTRCLLRAAQQLRDGLANHRPQSSSASRLTAGAAGFFTFIQQSVRPER
jgi:hypothetical protein